jgi:hypothetical protein
VTGNPILGRLAKLDRRVDDHETRLTAVEREIRSISRDQAMMGNIVIRCLERARRWSPPRRRR